jgi:ankyrin repeat protein
MPARRFFPRQRATGAGNVTALHVAAAHNATDVIEALLSGGADVGARTTDGSTPLLRAAATGAVGAMTALVAAGANPTHQVRAPIQRSV